jgi:hypothetical protein
MIGLGGYVALITGGGRGLGRAYADLLAARGATVIVHDAGVAANGSGSDPSIAAAAADAINRSGGAAEAAYDDLGTRAGCRSLVAGVLERHGRVDALVHSAGLVLRGPLDEITSGLWSRSLNVLKALGFRDGFTHMEWYRKADGEVVFGEIGARPPGARTVDVMNYATDADLFSAWAHAVTRGHIPHPVERRYNAASIFKRAQCAGRITRYQGLDRLLASYGEHVAALKLLPVGAPRRDWRATTIADGMVIIRHPELAKAMEIAQRFAAELHLHAGRRFPPHPGPVRINDSDTERVRGACGAQPATVRASWRAPARARPRPAGGPRRSARARCRSRCPRRPA